MLTFIRRAIGLLPDPFLIGIVGAAALGAILPCHGWGAAFFTWLTTLAIGLMFFMQGVRLSRESVAAGLAHWRLHLAILACTFVLYPALGIGLHAVAAPLLPPQLWIGVVFLCLLPSTVQSSIAYVSIARGNVAAAVVSATASNLIGILLTPLLAALLLKTHGGPSPLAEITKIGTHILAPFVLGQLLRPKLGAWAARHKPLLTISDRGSIMLAVYTAFSAATLQGVWQSIPPQALAWLIVLELALLAAVFAITFLAARAAGFSVEDQIAIVFCGAKKSLASGAPIASVIFPPAILGAAIIPLVLFHQMQLMAAAAIARRFARRPEELP